MNILIDKRAYALLREMGILIEMRDFEPSPEKDSSFDSYTQLGQGRNVFLRKMGMLIEMCDFDPCIKYNSPINKTTYQDCDGQSASILEAMGMIPVELQS